jgi:two-component system cell cycle response regulator
VAHAKRHGAPLSLMLIDIDHFKKVNDTYGHPAGDRILRGVSAVVSPALRREDVFARFGGEEFAVLVRSADLSTAMDLAQRLRRTIEESTFDSDGTTIRVTISAGVASLAPLDPKTSATLIAAADAALYRAKHRGRNRVEAHEGG